jgi:hypothetical protein
MNVANKPKGAFYLLVFRDSKWRWRRDLNPPTIPGRCDVRRSSEAYCMVNSDQVSAF